jgi:hypothetical protein
VAETDMSRICAGEKSVIVLPTTIFPFLTKLWIMECMGDSKTFYMMAAGKLAAIIVLAPFGFSLR